MNAFDWEKTAAPGGMFDAVPVDLLDAVLDYVGKELPEEALLAIARQAECPWLKRPEDMIWSEPVRQRPPWDGPEERQCAVECAADARRRFLRTVRSTLPLWKELDRGRAGHAAIVSAIAGILGQERIVFGFLAGWLLEWFGRDSDVRLAGLIRELQFAPRGRYGKIVAAMGAVLKARDSSFSDLAMMMDCCLELEGLEG